MIKSVFAATAALSVSAGAAFAGPYVNVEANSGFTGSSYNGTATDLHVGYEGELGESASYYVQGGATVVSPDGGESDTVPSGKAGVGIGLTDALGAYGEVSFVGSGDSNVDRGYGTKLGLKYMLLINSVETPFVRSLQKSEHPRGPSGPFFHGSKYLSGNEWHMLSTQYRLRLEFICKCIANGEEVKLSDMIWANKLAKANTSANEMLKMARRQITYKIEEGSTDDFLNRMGLGDPDPSNHKKGFTDADDIKNWFQQDKPSDWRQRD